jgi:hypothetical protein
MEWSGERNRVSGDRQQEVADVGGGCSSGRWSRRSPQQLPMDAGSTAAEARCGGCCAVTGRRGCRGGAPAQRPCRRRVAGPAGGAGSVEIEWGMEPSGGGGWGSRRRE